MTHGGLVSTKPLRNQHWRFWLRRVPYRRGQSLVEFALVLPMLLVLLLGVADFGRVFQAGIALEAAARNAAEAAAQEYVQRQRVDPLTPLTSTDYDAIRAVAHRVACGDSTTLPNQSLVGGVCAMPISAVCVHDADMGEPDCGEASGAVPPECTAMSGGWTPAIQQNAGSAPYLPYVEVRLCYRFTTLFGLSDLRLPFGWNLTLGDVWLQRDRSFVAGMY